MQTQSASLCFGKIALFQLGFSISYVWDVCMCMCMCVYVYVRVVCVVLFIYCLLGAYVCALLCFW